MMHGRKYIKQQLLPCKTRLQPRWCVYCAVRTKSSHNTQINFRLCVCLTMVHINIILARRSHRARDIAQGAPRGGKRLSPKILWGIRSNGWTTLSPYAPCQRIHNFILQPIPVAARFKARVCGRSLAGTVGSNHAGGTDVCLLWVLLWGLCVGLITRPEESNRVWRVWVWSWSLDNEKALAH